MVMVGPEVGNPHELELINGPLGTVLCEWGTSPEVL